MNTITRLTLLLSLGLCLAATKPTMASVYYQDITDAGTSAGTIGIGGIQGFSDQASVIFENPAALIRAKNSASAFYATYFDESKYLNTALSYQLNSAFTIGIGIAYQQSANLDHTATSNAGNTVASVFNTDNLQVNAGLTFKAASNLHLGLGWTEYLNNTFDSHGSGGDLGVGAYLNTSYGDFSLSGKNILSNSVQFNDNAKESLASQWVLGFKSTPLKFMSAEWFSQIKKTANISSPFYAIGLRLYPQKNIALNFGYKEKPSIDSTRGTFILGLILKLDPLVVEYGFDTTEVYQNNNQHYLSLAYHY